MPLADLGRKGVRLTTPPRFDGDVERWTEAVSSYLDDRMSILEALIGGGLRWQNLRAEVVTGVAVTSGGGPNVHSGVVHGLGKIPEIVVFQHLAAGQDFFIASADKSAWTTRTLQFTEQNGAGGTVDLFVL